MEELILVFRAFMCKLLGCGKVYAVGPDGARAYMTARELNDFNNRILASNAKLYKENVEQLGEARILHMRIRHLEALLGLKEGGR